MNQKYKNLLTYSVPVLMGFGLITAVIWGKAKSALADEYSKLADEYINTCVNSCARCADELEDSVSEMSISLSKLSITHSNEGQVLALEDIVRESAEASALLSRLPQSQIKVMELSNFLTRTGDYARSLSRKLLSGGSLDEQDDKQLSSTLTACESLAHELSARIANGEMPIGTEEFDYYDTPDEEQAESANGASEDEPSEPEYPTLIYDGPFSESTEKAQPKGVTGVDGTEADAKAIAERIAGCQLQSSGKSLGRIPTYDFSGDGVDISITVKGLHLIRYMRPASGTASGVPEKAEYEKLEKAGEDFLSQLGYTDMSPTYAQYYDGAALISYAWTLDGALVYNDLVKVWIDRESHELIGIDAQNYLFSHHERQAPAPSVSEQDAAQAVSERLSVTKTGLAIIPLTPQTETLCYEFRGSCEDSEYIVYVNAETGREEQIFKIISDENGQSAV